MWSVTTGPDRQTVHQSRLSNQPASSGIGTIFMTVAPTKMSLTLTIPRSLNCSGCSSSGFSDPAWLWKQRGLNYYWETIKMFPSSQFGRRAAGDGRPPPTVWRSRHGSAALTSGPPSHNTAAWRQGGCYCWPLVSRSSLF